MNKAKGKKRPFFILKITGGCFLFFILCSLFVFIYYAKDLPRPEVFTERPFVLPTKIYDREGKVLLSQIYGEEKRTVISLDQMPEHLKQAFLAAEDSNFYNHHGLDLMGIFRSVLINLQIGEFTYGGSTISQQFIRSSFLTLEKTANRKIKEIVLTLELERRYSKDQILEFYLNQVPFGSNAYGVEAAAQTFFEKPASEVSLEEAALLASLVQAPSYLSPYGYHKDDLFARKNWILDRMAILGYTTEEQKEEAKNKTLEFAKATYSIKAPHFVFYVKQYLEENYSENFLKEKGLKVYTTLDWNLQEIAEKAVKDGVKVNQGYNAYNASLVAIQPQTGEILAMVGSADYFGELYPERVYPEECTPGYDCLFESEVNIATYGEGRQPGSAFKPFAYAEAFRGGLTPETVLWDVKTEFNPNCAEDASQEKDQYGLDCYHPENYTGTFSGPITLRKALAQSINVPSVKTLYLAGLQDTIDLAKNLGITTLNRSLSWYGLSLVLGGGEVRLLDMVSSYGVFAARGLKTPPVSILRIEDSEGNIIEENKKSQKRVLESQVADLINDILSDNKARTPVFGSRSSLYIDGYQVAAKTGTTQEYKDAWAIGYTPSLVAGVWAGNNNGTPSNKKPGVVLAGPIWNSFMRQALVFYPSGEFMEPEPIQNEKAVLKGDVDWLNPHSILYYIKKDNPQETPENPGNDPQYNSWEKAIEIWLQNH
ncbi:MAG: transglycosylase domain-containing protein [Candidatus Nealsonbacteria bacterium]